MHVPFLKKLISMHGMQRRIFFTCVYFFGLLAYGLVQLEKEPSTITTQPTSIKESDKSYKYRILEERSTLIDEYYRVSDFLTAYPENKKLALLTNTTSEVLFADFSKAFYTFTRIESELGRVERNHSGALKLYEYFADKYVFTKSQYYHQLEKMDYTPYFFSVSSSGFCNSAAANFVYLAQHYGFPARVVKLEGHVVAEIFYENGWHMFDPSYARYILNDYGSVASILEVNALAKNNFFSDPYYSKAFSSKSEFRYPKKLSVSEINPVYSFMLFPQERVLFYDDLWMLTTDGVTVEQEYADQPFISIHSAKVANFVREIPLSALSEEMKKHIEIDSVFPLAGAFIYLPNHFNKNNFVTMNLPQVQIQTKRLRQDQHYYEMPIRYYQIRDKSYISLSEFILNFEDVYSTKIVIKNIGNIFKISQQAKLILLYQYVPSHVKWNELEIEGKKKQIEVQLQAS